MNLAIVAPELSVEEFHILDKIVQVLSVPVARHDSILRRVVTHVRLSLVSRVVHYHQVPHTRMLITEEPTVPFFDLLPKIITLISYIHIACRNLRVIEQVYRLFFNVNLIRRINVVVYWLKNRSIG